MRKRKFFIFYHILSTFFLLTLTATECVSFAAPQNPTRDSWYVMTVDKTIRYGYYNERVELKRNRLFFQSHVWKKEEDYINEEQLGAFSENTPDLAPLFYNFHSTYRSSELTIDGNVKDGKVLHVKVRKGQTELPIIRKVLAPKTIFSQFFPVWLGFQLPKLKPGQSVSFLSILEDNLDLNFATVPGRIRLEKPDEFATKSGTRKISLEYREVKSTWYVDETGTAVRIEMPETRTVVEKVSKEVAQKFLSN